MKYNRIHPLFKSFILNNALKEWRRMTKRKLTEEDQKFTAGMTGNCFQTSFAFQHILEKDFGIPCSLLLVNTTIGNRKAGDLFDKDMVNFYKNYQRIRDETRGKRTADDPFIILVGSGSEFYHCIILFQEHGEIGDFTIGSLHRPELGIICKNYWAKYDKEMKKKGMLTGDDIRKQSNYVLFSTLKENPDELIEKCGLNSDCLQDFPIGEIRTFINRQVRKQNIHIFEKTK